MDGTKPQSDATSAPADDGTVSRAARDGNHDAIVELARRGGRAKAERSRRRRAAIEATTTLATIEDRQRALEWAMARLKSSELDPARIATATAALVREFRAEAGVEAMAEELERLRSAIANALVTAGVQEWTTNLASAASALRAPVATIAAPEPEPARTASLAERFRVRTGGDER